MQLITFFLNWILARALTREHVATYVVRKTECEKLGMLLPFEFADNSKVFSAVEKLWQTGRYGQERLTAIVPIGVMAQRKDFANTQSEFEGVYICRAYFGRDVFATMHIYSDGTWKEVADIDHTTGGVR